MAAMRIDGAVAGHDHADEIHVDLLRRAQQRDAVHFRIMRS